jgi:hypothetical protein
METPGKQLAAAAAKPVLSKSLREYAFNGLPSE